MKYLKFLVLLFIVTTFSSCSKTRSKGEELAAKNCSTCHMLPSPALLNKRSWKTGVLPEMKFRMGLDKSKLWTFSQSELKLIQAIIPDHPISEADFQAISDYYINNAPDSLAVRVADIADTTIPFKVEQVTLPLPGIPSGTLIRLDTLNDLLYYGTRQGNLFRMDRTFHIIDSFDLKSPPSDIILDDPANPTVLTMGVMDPNDLNRGSILSVDTKQRRRTELIDSLRRPVHFVRKDFNRDGVEDYVISMFGNYTGALVIYEGQSNGEFKQHVLQALPGARKVVIDDFDRNGLPDILALMSQGDEQLIMLKNQGNFKFWITRLLRFPPAYGSSYFEILDFNGDGKFDILYSNGDNGDYSIVLKPYHGIRIYLNDGTNDFKESTFIPMPGASKAIARDFDLDGDVDIAAISFFPDFKTHPDQGFIFYENQNGNFIPKVTPEARNARWIMMEDMDIDDNGTLDLVLVALTFPTEVPRPLFEQWNKDRVSFLVLKNTTPSSQK